MLLLAALIFAFAQPFFAEKSALKVKEMVVYLDDSFSMQAKTDNTTLLEDAVQNLIKSVPLDQKITLFTNQRVFKNRSIKSLQNDLLTLTPTPKQLKLAEIYLKAKTFFSHDQSTAKNLVVVSDFQQRIGTATADSSTTTSKHLVQIRADNLENVSLDSIYIATSVSDNVELTTMLSSNYDLESIPVSLFNGEKLIAKTAAHFDENKKAKINFTLRKNEAIDGKIEISDGALTYDNQLFFNIEAKEKIKVLAIGSANSDYLKRIFTTDEFLFTSFSLKNLNYGDLNDQHLIILNALEALPNALTNSLKSFTANNGTIVIIPNTKIDFSSYNQLVSSYYNTNFMALINDQRKITGIAFSHPLYRNVFEKNVSNFQYPKVSQYFKVKTNAPNILSYQNKAPFLLGLNGVFVFTASLSSENSNFKNSPLIVPTLYNMGINSLKLPPLYQYLGTAAEIDIPIQLPKDHILKVAKGELEFIPKQKSFANKVRLTFDENPADAGIFSIMDKENLHKKISFNYSREESQLNYLDFNSLNASTKNQSINTLFQEMQNDNTVDELWKWFVILAALFMFTEVLIQKYL